MPHDIISHSHRLVALTFDTGSCRDDYRTRLDIMTRDLDRLAPDIVLLQNVFATADGRHNTAAHLARRLRLNCAFQPVRPKIRYFDGRPVQSHSGLAILSRHDIVDTVHADLPCDARDGERIAQFADLDIDGTRLLVANIQVSHLAGHDAVRRHQIERLAGWLAAAHDYEHMLVGGDFNAGPDEPALSPIRGLHGLAVAEAAPERGVDRLFALSRPASLGLPSVLTMAGARSVLDGLDMATNQFPGERPALAADLTLRNGVETWRNPLQPWASGFQIAAE